MRISNVQGIMDRRILVNYRVDPERLESLLPPPFRPHLVRGAAVVGICLIRLRNVRPVFVPSFLGITSENAAHRFAVEWESDGQLQRGVYIPRRDTNSRFNALVGGRFFPGIHHHARFRVQESEQQFRIALDSDDKQMHVLLESRLTPNFPGDSVFRSLGEASRFFREGSLGYSDSRNEGQFDGLQLSSSQWKMDPLEVTCMESSFFDDPNRFPEGSVAFDCALLMRGIQHEWVEQPALCCEAV